ncbi:SIMPL domain-containing protein [Methyloferula stellata]|uniref:SIMPL domain-containing protein n=1 Tax=Methyloferula stellata TaxID=876270 RepID=UPI000479EF74|nr:SIMPL domain-containing protein [Methyloferula stellata]
MSFLRLSLACLVMLPIAAHAQDVPLRDQLPHITTTGSAHANVMPDLAIISFAVVTERPTASAASSDNAAAAQAVVGEVKAQGIDPKDIRTVSVTLSPVYDESRDASGHLVKRTLRAYSARNGLEVRVHAIDKAGALARQLIEKGANNFGGISFEVEHPEPKLRSLQTEATKDALARAQSYVDALGLKLGRVIEIAPPGEGTPYPAAPRAKFAAAMPAPPEAGAAAAIPIEPGFETLATSVSVTWELVQ